LAKLGESAHAALRKALDEQPSTEARRRIEGLLEKLEVPVTAPEELRGLRAAAALARMDRAAGRPLLEALASGVPEARLTREAKASLERLLARRSR
jgi:hypothetical protein